MDRDDLWAEGGCRSDISGDVKRAAALMAARGAIDEGGVTMAAYEHEPNQLGCYSSHIGNGHVVISYPKEMTDDDAKDVLDMMSIERNRILRRMRENDWCNAASTG